MSRVTRLFLFALCGGLAGFWLNVAAIVVVVGSNGLSTPYGQFSAVVELAFWPSRLCGTRPEHYFQPDPIRHHVVNILGWTILGALGGLLYSEAVKGSESPPSRGDA